MKYVLNMCDQNDLDSVIFGDEVITACNDLNGMKFPNEAAAREAARDYGFVVRENDILDADLYAVVGKIEEVA